MTLLNRLLTPRRVKYISTKTNLIRHKSKMETYENAIKALNGIQSNAAYIKSRSYQNSSFQDDYRRTILHTKHLLSKVGIDDNDLNKLSIIHVAGTKGKGSTCAYTESVLRHHGFKTGFYSSPHLLEVRERIRINGEPLPYNKFSKYFWKIFPVLKSPENLPLQYFQFLTIMAFQVFIKEKVDVAIFEVGIGGEFDNTNIVEKVPVVGITSLGIDHTGLLGDSIEKIAWHKAGIIKHMSQVYTVPQPIQALKVIMERSEEKQAHLEVIQPFLNGLQQTNSYPDVNNLNASLAVVLAHSWMKLLDQVPSLDLFCKMPQTLKGLSQFSWPGRYQIIKHSGTTYFLDGAHTSESIQICKKWYDLKTAISRKAKALIFNIIGQRDSEKMLSILMLTNFDKVIFVPNISGISDSLDNKVSDSSYMEDKCYQHKETWLKLLENNGKKVMEENVLVFPNVLVAVNYLSSGEYDCLITGSLHLMGAALEVLDPELKC